MIRKNADGTLTDGTFDDTDQLVRQRYIQGKVTHTINKMWIESDNIEHLNRLSDWQKKPWGTYPDIPLRFKNK